MRIVLLFSLILSFSAYADFKDNIEGFTEPTTGILVIPFIPTLISWSYTESQKHNKLFIIKPKSDAAIYVVSEGEINSAYLEQALVMLRKRYPNTSDMELAKAILAY